MNWCIFLTTVKSMILHSLLAEACSKIRIYFDFVGLVALFIWNNLVVSKFDFPKLCLSRKDVKCDGILSFNPSGLT